MIRAVRSRLSALLALCLLADPARAQGASAAHDVILATTTSLYDTGLLDSLAPMFERVTGLHLRVVAVGSGQALKMGERGDADVVLAHSPAAEREFMQAGYGLRRLVVASNYFTIVGPPEDPAGVRAAPSAAAALKRIAETEATFVSRGDSSGTHQRELAVWRAAGGLPAWRFYLESGQGMAATLLIADERRGYTLTDRGTYASLRRRLDLVSLREREAELLNVYHVIELNPAGHQRLNAAGGRAFAELVTSPAAQDLLAHFGESRFGEPLFIPARGMEPSP